HRDLAPQVALDLQLTLDDLAHARRLLVRPRLHPLVRVDVGLPEDAHRRGLADPVDVRDRNLSPLLSRQIDSRHSRHTLSPLASLYARLERRPQPTTPVSACAAGSCRSPA